MKFALAVMVLIPLALAAPQKKFVLDSILSVVNTDAIKQDLQIMVDAIGSDPTEQMCEQECHKIAGTGLLSHSCELICHSFQSLVHHFQIAPPMTTMGMSS